MQKTHNLTLTVSDGKDEVGTSDIGKDSEIDDVLGLDVNLTGRHRKRDGGHRRRPHDVGNRTSSHANCHNQWVPPGCGDWTSYQWHEDAAIQGGTGLTTIYNHSTAGTKSYYLILGYEDAKDVHHTYTSNTIQVTWTD